MSEAYIQQIERKINALLADGKYKEAYKTVRLLLERFPTDHIVKAAYQRVVREVQVENERFVHKTLPEAANLISEKKFKEAIVLLEKLKSYQTGEEKIGRLLQKAKLAYKNEIENKKHNFIKNLKKYLMDLYNKKDPDILSKIFEIERNNIHQKDILKITRDFKSLLIKRKIDENRELIYSDKFSAIHNLIIQLKKINPEDSQIKKLELATKGNKHLDQTAKKDDFVYGAVQHLDTLMKLKKFDKAMQVAKEILEINPQHTSVKNTYKKARKAFYNQTRDLSIDQIKSAHDQELASEQKNPEKYVQV